MNARANHHWKGVESVPPFTTGWRFRAMQIALPRFEVRIAGTAVAEASILFFAEGSDFHPFLTSPV